MSAAEQPWIVSVSFRNILVAMDLSPRSLRALPFAVSIARHYSGKVFFSHIVGANEYDPLNPASRVMLGKLEAGAEEGLLTTLGSGLKDVPHELLLDHGSICARLLDTAQRCDIDLIVLGTHGWQGIRKLLKGSTAEELAHLAARPVLTVGPKVSTSWNFRHILYETDLSDAAAHAFPYAVSLAQTYQATMSLLHVNEWRSHEPPVAAAPTTSQFFHEQMYKLGFDAGHSNYDLIVEYGTRADRILELAESRLVDLIVMGLNCSKALKARISAHLPGSTAYRVIAEAHCPVLTVPFTG